MMKSSRGNRLFNAWTCPHCATGIDTRTFQLAPTDSSKIVCPNRACGRRFSWRTQNKGKLWPESRAYSVLR